MRVNPDRQARIAEIWINRLVIGAVVPFCVAPVVTWRLPATMRALKHAHAELDTLVRIDPFTGLLNRRGFEEAAQTAITNARRAQAPVALLMCDIDHFKAVNDRHGHEVGDRAIRHVAALLAEAGRGDGAVIARHGDEEFCLLVTGLSIRQAMESADTARRVCIEQPFAIGEEASPMMISVSIGLAMAAHDDADCASLIARADAALDRAKTEERNRVERAAA
ncbi:MAG: GGDEF domain-containing protein [Hyphomicrobiales bacterium]|nr:GGDEF domain-containing protein [Hyphomicrobiales bacterium]